MAERLALLTQLETAVRQGVAAVQLINSMRGKQMDLFTQAEARKQIDSAWADILLTLDELDQFPPPPTGGGEGVKE